MVVLGSHEGLEQDCTACIELNNLFSPQESRKERKGSEEEWVGGTKEPG